MKKLGIIVVAALSFGAALIAQPVMSTPTAQAKTKVSVVWKKSMGKHSYQINASKAKGAYAYTSKLGKKVFKLSNYPNTTFYTKGHEALKIGKSTRIYYYIQSANGKKAGWVWRGYLTTPVMSQSALTKLINSSTDLDPSATLLKQSSAFYSKYRATLRKNYNMTGALTSFTNHQTRVYVSNAGLKSYVTKAMSVWNKALGKKVFIAGTASQHDLVVSSKASNDWDGLNDGTHLYLSSTALKDASYVNSVADTPEIRDLYNQYEDVAQAYKSAKAGSSEKASYLTKGHDLYTKLVAAQKAAAPTATNYWESVLVHELGHSLGLDHTPYLTDIMYAETSDDGFSSSVNGKYSWTSPKDPTQSRRETPSLSTRDVDRAKLAQKLGYW